MRVYLSSISLVAFLFFFMGCRNPQFSDRHDTFVLKVEESSASKMKVVLLGIPPGFTVSKWGENGLEVFREDGQSILKSNVDSSGELMIYSKEKSIEFRVK